MSDERVRALVALLDRSLRRLGESGQIEDACRIAASGWAVLERDFPAEAQRLNGTLHYLMLVVPGDGRRRPRARAQG